MSTQALYRKLRNQGVLAEKRGDYVLVLPEPLLIKQCNAFQFDAYTGEKSPKGQIVFVVNQQPPFLVPRYGEDPLELPSAQECVKYFAEHSPQQWLVTYRRGPAFPNDGNTLLRTLRNDYHLFGVGGLEVPEKPSVLLQESNKIDFTYQYAVVTLSDIDLGFLSLSYGKEMKRPFHGDMLTLYRMFCIPKAVAERAGIKTSLFRNLFWREYEDDSTSFYYILASLYNTLMYHPSCKEPRNLLDVFFRLPQELQRESHTGVVTQGELLGALAQIPPLYKGGYSDSVLYNVFMPFFSEDPFMYPRLRSGTSLPAPSLASAEAISERMNTHPEDFGLITKNFHGLSDCERIHAHLLQKNIEHKCFVNEGIIILAHPRPLSMYLIFDRAEIALRHKTPVYYYQYDMRTGEEDPTGGVIWFPRASQQNARLTKCHFQAPVIKKITGSGSHRTIEFGGVKAFTSKAEAEKYFSETLVDKIMTEDLRIFESDDCAEDRGEEIDL